MNAADNARACDLAERIDATMRAWSDSASVNANIVIHALLLSLSHAAWDSGCTNGAERKRAVPLISAHLSQMLAIREEIETEKKHAAQA